MLTHKDIQYICDKCKNGVEPEQNLGRTVPPNPHHDFHKFAEWLGNKTAKRVSVSRPGTIAQYVMHLSKIREPITKELIMKFTDVLDQCERDRHQYLTPTHNNLKNWESSFDKMPDHKREASTARFQYKIYLAVKNYLEFLGKDDWVLLLPQTKSIAKPSRYIKTEYLGQKEFDKFISFVDDMNFNVYYRVMYYSGARFGELIYSKKNTQWIPSYQMGSIDLNTDVLFKITVPDEFVKRRKKVTTGYQNLYIDDKETIRLFTQWVNKKVKNQGYIFVFSDISDARVGKNFRDIEKEKKVIREHMAHTLRKAGFGEDKIHDMTIHGFRRSMIHRVQDQFSQIELTQKRARHSTMNQTGEYLSIADKELEKALQERMNERGN